MTQENSYKGFSTFNDIDDQTLRTRNRACILANIAESNVRNRLISPKGAGLILGYMSKIISSERQAVTEKFKETMLERGFKLV